MLRIDLNNVPASLGGTLHSPVVRHYEDATFVFLSGHARRMYSYRLTDTQHAEIRIGISAYGLQDVYIVVLGHFSQAATLWDLQYLTSTQDMLSAFCAS